MNRRAIRRSSFSAAARLLPPEAKEGTLRLYATCRRLDDLVDRQGGAAARERLSQVMDELSRDGSDAILPEARVFHDLAKRHGLRLGPGRHLVETLAGDLAPARIRTEAELVAYARGAAGTVGEMMCDLLCPGGVTADARRRAADLGVAMQLTNIARDVRDDADMGRRYLPADWCNLPPERLAAPAPGDRDLVLDAVGRTLRLAERHYRRARHGYGALPPRARLAVALAAERYREIGRGLAASPGTIWERSARPSAIRRFRGYAAGLARGLSTGPCAPPRSGHA